MLSATPVGVLVRNPVHQGTDRSATPVLPALFSEPYFSVSLAPDGYSYRVAMGEQRSGTDLGHIVTLKAAGDRMQNVAAGDLDVHLDSGRLRISMRGGHLVSFSTFVAGQNGSHLSAGMEGMHWYCSTWFPGARDVEAVQGPFALTTTSRRPGGAPTTFYACDNGEASSQGSFRMADIACFESTIIFTSPTVFVSLNLVVEGSQVQDVTLRGEW